MSVKKTSAKKSSAKKTSPKKNVTSLRADEELGARIDALRERQQRFFDGGATLSAEFRLERLKRLDDVLRRHESRMLDALYSDLHKPEVEGYGTEVGFTYSELRHTIKNLRKWMKPQRNLSPMVTQPSSSWTHSQPLGLTLIISPWNYPIQLALGPMIGAIAAGNVAVVKPSEMAPASSEVVTSIVAEAFGEEHVAILEGGVELSTALLERRWDHVFFTGSTQVGRIVAKAAAEHLSRVTLELGGKSPTIVTPSADLRVAARRIAWGKFVNTGQTCVAPDYVLVHRSVADAFTDQLRTAITDFYGPQPRRSPDYGRIINERHFQRLERLIDPSKVVFGGETAASERYIAPTLMRGVSLDDPVMQQEIFGPVLPIIEIDSLDEAISTIRKYPNPLALYLFSSDRHEEERVIAQVSFGGGCINNTLVHLADSNLAFGGVGQSGLGAYHGHHSFGVFSHQKSVLRSATFVDPDVKYAPYEGKMGIVRRLVR